MNGEGCWSTVVCTSAERTALGLTGRSDWLLNCRLSSGHGGNHATDAGTRPRHDRRLWLEWNDFADHAQSLIERNPCTVRSQFGAHCQFFEGHGGAHYFATSNGHPTAGHRGAQTGQARAAAGPSTGSRPTVRRDPVGPPGHADRVRTTTDSDIPAVRPSATAPGTPAIAAASESDGKYAYRGGRRSTNAEPPADSAPRVSRHLLPDRAVAEHGEATVSTDERAEATVSTDETETAGDGRLAVADALSEVATALEKLAVALRRR
ncbi:hypothetical protein AAFP30_10990 [Gordonia sp. CPCC 205515]|uniref:hypothetical protein n=1 Tax=Gordonia sp. CPCC 205515 TaxID=3140791 RepID=UPI003AF3ED30